MTPLWKECAAHHPDAAAVIRAGETWQVGPANCSTACWVKQQQQQQQPADRQTERKLGGLNADPEQP